MRGLLFALLFWTQAASAAAPARAMVSAAAPACDVSRAAFSRELTAALERVDAGLQHNHMYWFDIPVLGRGLPRMGALRGWERVMCSVHDDPSVKCFAVVSGETEAAFHSLYHGRFSSDCATGAELTQYAAIHELFGSATANYFKPDEFFVSDWDDNYPSNSVLYGRHASMPIDITFQKTAKLGPGAFVGVSGGIASVFDESYLDSKINRNENLVVMKTSEDGAKALATKGLKNYVAITRELWEKSRVFTREDISAIGDGHMPKHDQAKANRIIEILNDPFLRDTVVRVHPRGSLPIARYLVRLLEINPRTPYYIVFYPSAMHTGVFERWVKFRRDTCTP